MKRKLRIPKFLIFMAIVPLSGTSAKSAGSGPAVQIITTNPATDAASAIPSVCFLDEKIEFQPPITILNI